MSRVCYIVLTCEKYLPTRGQAVRDTWAQGAEVWFLSAKENREARVLGWNTADDYTSCAAKYLEFFRNEFIDADWIVLVDDDTFVYRDRLESHLNTLNSESRICLGQALAEPTNKHMSGGAGIVLSKALYSAVSSFVRTASKVPMDSTYSDITLCCWISNIEDVQVISDTRFHWKAADSPEEARTAFTFHYARPEDMHAYMNGASRVDISILIPTMTHRKRLFEKVLAEIKMQARSIPEIKTEILWESDNGELTLGQKRNILVDRCVGKYHCFIDDDDVLAPDYLKTFVPMIASGIDYDCASFVGAHYKRGVFNKLFHHSMKYTEWDETPERFIRTVSPMNLIKTSIVRQVRYKDIRNIEDHEFSKRLMASGLLKTEYEINPNHPIYHYIDEVKADREEWTYTWRGEYIYLYKSFIRPDMFQTPPTQSVSSTNIPLGFLRISRH
jgi:hypothetical protein